MDNSDKLMIKAALIAFAIFLYHFDALVRH